MDIDWIFLDRTTSTNSWVREECATFQRDLLTVVSAREQTRGYGRLGRKWIAQRDTNVTASFCFFAEEGSVDLVKLTILLATVIKEVVGGCGVVAAIKWPNDVMVEKKKISGILCETIFVEGDMQAVVVGLGLNVNMTESECSMIDQPATSLLVETGQQHDIKEITERIATAFARKLLCYINNQ
ncbi:biotin--[acetyl-CoA-carboxylase] ligase [Simkania negevensis]|uniref:Biotin--[acetyl-CoA-carboxylase] ligase n=1 Tax=Simkania negevensis TaxID=83561 RepID=A0ABS3ART5_9BACT|nr:biotin--[acetyl-CoA-carboxylase] ligase [Simkania negevensis]